MLQAAIDEDDVIPDAAAASEEAVRETFEEDAMGGDEIGMTSLLKIASGMTSLWIFSREIPPQQDL